MTVRDIIIAKQSGVYGTGETDHLKRPLSAQFEARLWKPTPDSEQAAHFSLTGAVSVKREPLKDSDPEMCGSIHSTVESIAHKLKGSDALLPSLVKWHLFSVKTGPAHYSANAAYFFLTWLRKEGRLPKTVTLWGYKNGDKDKDPLGSFKSLTLFGHIEGEELPEVPELPRMPDKSDLYVYSAQIAKERALAWEKEADRIITASVAAWCEKRLPRLMADFERDMIACFGAEVSE